MINFIWLGMIIAGSAVALVAGNSSLVTDSIIKGSENAVETAIGLAGIIAFWSGIMRIADDSGLTKAIANLLRPVVHWLFPGVRKDHSAAGAITMSMSANLLGLGNAATPLGLKAMKELQSLNKSNPEEASPDECTFVAITTSSLTLIPAGVIALRASKGSLDPAEITGTTFLATLCSTTAAICLDRFFRAIHGARPPHGIDSRKHRRRK